MRSGPLVSNSPVTQQSLSLKPWLDKYCRQVPLKHSRAASRSDHLPPGPASAKALMARQMHLPCAIRALPNHSARWRTGFHLEGGRSHRRRSVSPKAVGLTEGGRSHRSPRPRWLRSGSRHSPARNWRGHPPFEGYPNIKFKLRTGLR